jgi:translation initiation factor IF-2
VQIRVHELAKELKISNMALRKHLNDMGVIVKSHMSLIDEEIADKIRKKYYEQVDAEKRAEKDRKRLQEMRQAAKAKVEEIPQERPREVSTAKAVKPGTEKSAKSDKTRKGREGTAKKEVSPKSVVSPSKVEPYSKPEIRQAEPIEPTTSQPKTEKVLAKQKPPTRIIVPHQQAAPVISKDKKGSAKPRTEAVTKERRTKEAQKPAREKRGKEELGEKTTTTVVPISIEPIEPPKETEVKKFGKSRFDHEELGEKSKHKRAIVSSAKKSKQKDVFPSDVDEAEISRNIKKILQKSKKKKYHKEAQIINDNTESKVIIREVTSVSELAKILNINPAEIISKFFAMGQLVTMNQRLDRDSLEMICDEFNVDFQFEDEYGADILDKEKELFADAEYEPRPPVVTIMGHVDHGKTSILDYIRNTNVVAGEAGGITQHIGAYQIEINKNKITFIDTPGHEAFTAMRARGANVTDIAVIVVAANEGIKPQTKEAIDHAKAAGVPIIIAINKIDLPDANVNKVIAKLLDYGVMLEQYGGEVPWCTTSAVTGEGILNLIELILIMAELMGLKARRTVPGSGVVLEAQKDPRMGSIATILVKEGSIKKGDIVVCGATHGRIRRIENERGQEIKELYPSDVGRIFGLNDIPKAGDLLNQVDSEKTARAISTERNQIRLEREKYQNQASLQNIFERIRDEQLKELNLIIKADTDGSVEALADSLAKISNPQVILNIIHKSVGGINEADVSLAAASDAIIIGFRVRANQQAKKMAEEEKVDMRLYQIIYDAIEDVEASLEGLLQPEYKEQIIGTATVRQVFKIKKVGTVAGCQIDSGCVKKGCSVKIYRDDVMIAEDNIASLKHYANDVEEVRAGSECGITLANFSDIKEGDVFEFYVLEESSPK